ncbi:Cupin-like domain-containing protein [Sphingomonas gellani]|uniref:Cupin-like domain-containing protein n=1 Tax=Sphingomonas gellani TaxID=1166340 RepID=A0A1H8AX39_9SPHN|nr:cupin-like domain-containing protein [Sphingomonas gellani]SEM75046.1 Cupin-like domain-containing protein [Sphingomonas gellani]
MSSMPPERTVPSVPVPDQARFAREIVPHAMPVVMRGLVSAWPLVAAARKGIGAVAEQLVRLDSGRPLNVFTAPYAQGGRFFYADDMRGLNFNAEQATLTRLLAALVELAGEDEPPALYAGAAPTAENLAGFEHDHPLPITLSGATSRIWIGNRSRIATHFDMSNNIACVAAGRRRFTLFPPEQVGNLYVGPLERTPAGQPVSMVDPLAPDLNRYPDFAEAQRAMLVADLEPGDAIYIPALWWHQVSALDELNILVNYWQPQTSRASPLNAMIHSLSAIRDLPASERDAWRSWFDHYVFGDEASAVGDHLPDHARGVLGSSSEQRRYFTRHLLYEELERLEHG